MLGGGTGGGGLFGTPQTGLGRGTSLGGGGIGGGTGGLFSRQTGGLFGGAGGSTLGGGATGGGLFGQTPSSSQQSGGLFGGGGLGAGATGSGLFQTPQSGLGAQQKTTGGLFGQSPMLGGGTSTGGGMLGGGAGGGGLFSNQTSTGGGLFGAKSQSASGLTLGGGTGGLQLGQLGQGLGQTATTGGIFSGAGQGGLGGLGAQNQGTATKYEPVKGTDTLNKSGVTVQVNTRLHCITASNTYQNKSLEELRVEDYAVGRKGSTTAGGGLFGGAGALGGGGVGGGGLFGQNKGLGSGVGGGLLGGQQQQQLGSGLGGASMGGGLFSGQQNKLGGTGTATGGLFGATPQNKLGGGLGGGGLFSGQQQQQQQQGQLGGIGGGLFGGGGGMFGQSAGTGTQLGGGLGMQNQLGGGGLFRGGTAGGGLGGLQGGTGLGGTLGGGLGGGGLGNTGTGLGMGTGLGFQTSQAAGSNLFSKQTTGLGTGGLGLGQTAQLGGNLALGGGGLGGTTGLSLGGTGGLNTGLGGAKLGGGSLMGTGTTGLGGTSLGQNLGQSSLQAQQHEAQLKQQLEMLANSPFGDDALFRNAMFDASKQRKSKDSVTPVATKASPTTLQYKLNMRPSSKVKTISLSSPARHKEKNRLFEGLEDSPHSTSTRTLSAGATPETFVPRKSIKKLTIKPKPTQPQTWPDSTTPPVASTPLFSSSSAPPLSTLPSSVGGAPPTSSYTPSVDPAPSSPSEMDGEAEDRTTPTPVVALGGASRESTSVETPEITLGNNALKKSGIRSLTGAMSSIGASPSLGPAGGTAGERSSSLPSRATEGERSLALRGTGGERSLSLGASGGAAGERRGLGGGEAGSKRVTLVEPEVSHGDSLTRSPLRSHTGESPSPRGSPSINKRSLTRPCHVTLTRHGYYTIPPLDECDELVEEGACIVEGFTIGRKDYGEIHFPGQTDIYGLNLDRIVNIEAKEVVVYPDDLSDPKPLVGEELNKPAMIFMDGHWPKDKTTQELIKDKERLTAMNYSAKLQKLVQKIGGHFVEYKPETGTCIFQVEHFSKYKLDADDSDEDGDSQAGGVAKRLKTVQGQGTVPTQPLLPKSMQQKQQGMDTPSLQPGPLTSTQTPAEQPLTSAPRQDEEEDIQMDSPSPLEEERGVVMDTHSSSLHPAQEIVGGASTHHIQIMKASFFGKEDLNTTYSIKSPQPRQPLTQSSRPSFQRKERLPFHPASLATSSAQGLPYTLLHTSMRADKVTDPSPFTTTTTATKVQEQVWFPQPPPPPQADETLDPFSRYHTTARRPIPLAQRGLQAQSALLMAKRNLNVLVPMPAMERCLCDHGLFLGRSFRVGWGPNWTLAHSGRVLSPSSPSESAAAPTRSGWGQGGGLFSSRQFTAPAEEEEGHPIRVVVERVSPNSCDSFEPFLKSQLEKTEFQILSPSLAPHCSPVVGTSLLNAFSDVSRTSLLPSSSPAGDEATLRQLQRVLQLLVVLWGDLSAQCSSSKEMYDNQQMRKQRLYQWLKDTNSSATDQEMALHSVEEGEGYLKTLLSLVAGQQVAAACRLAQKNKDHKLALLLSQATYTAHTNRLFLCKQLETWGRLGVHTKIHPARLKLYVLLAGLNTWSQSWNKQLISVNTSEGLDWKRSFALHLCYSCGLNSLISDILLKYTEGFQGDNPYAPPPFPPYVEAAGGTGPYDTCYHLLQLYCNREYSMEATLQPAASTPWQLDYRISWLVWSVLSSLEYAHMHPTVMSQLVTSFASQLVSCGKWQWAVFVLLHLHDPVLTQTAVQDVLEHNCSSDEELSSSEFFVVEKLKVPKAWVHQAKALRASQEEWYDLKALHLLNAELWNSAHNTIMEHLAVDAIINGETDELLHMLEQLSEPERCGQVQGWECGGSIFLDYLRISAKFEQLQDSEDDPTQYDVENLHLGLKQLTVRLGQLPSDTPRRVLCQSDMAQHTANFTRVILLLKAKYGLEDKANEDIFVADGMSECLNSLPIPPDFALTECRALIHIYGLNYSELPSTKLRKAATATTTSTSS